MTTNDDDEDQQSPQGHDRAADPRRDGGLPPPARSGGNPPAGAMPSNTAPANCKSKTDFITILRFGIDSLYLSYPGALSQEADLELGAFKKAAQSKKEMDQAEAVYCLKDHRFEVLGRGARYFPFILADNAYFIQLAGVDNSQMPMAYVQIKSHWLTSLGVTAACADLLSVISNFGEVEGSAQVSRADLYVDFITPGSFEGLPLGSFVTRAKRISTHRLDNVLSGFSIGLGGDISARLYDKTKQIQVSGQDYLETLWQQAGWEPGMTVWRLEFEFKRRVLNEHLVNTVEDLLSKLGRLWLYATTEWLKLTVPNPSDATRARWPMHPIWADLTQVPWEGLEQGASVPVRSQRVPSNDKLYVLGVSGLTTFMACKGITNTRVAIEQFYHEARQYHDEKTFLTLKDFDTYCRQKAALKAKQFNLAYPDVDERAESRRTKVKSNAYRKARDGE